MKLKPDFTLCWGNCQDGQFGTKIGDESSIIGPRIFEMPFDLKKIVCGGKHTILVSNDGVLYSAGKNDYGQLGRQGMRGRYERITSLETKMIVDAACGANHTLVLDSFGYVYGFGDNRNGQLGFSSEFECFTLPKRLPDSLSDIVYIACGPFYSFAISDCNKIFYAGGKFYAFGSNACGQCLGPHDSSISINLMENIELSRWNIVKICGGMSHVVALTFNGYVYTWGSNTKYQLGLGYEGEIFRNPKIVSRLSDYVIIDIACGGNHTAVLTEDEKVFTFGDGSKGQLGNSTSYGEGYPYHVTSLDGLNISKIIDSTVAYSESSNSFYVLGSQSIAVSSGQTYYENVYLPKKLEFKADGTDISEYYPWSFSTCFDHTIVLLKSQKVEKLPPYVYPLPIISYGDDNSIIRHSDYNNFANLSQPNANRLLDNITKLFFSIPCLNASFLRKDYYHWRFEKHNINFELLEDFTNKLVRHHHFNLFIDALEFFITTNAERNDLPDNNRYNYIILYITIKLEAGNYIRSSILELVLPGVSGSMSNRSTFSKQSYEPATPFKFLPPSLFKNILVCCKNDFVDSYIIALNHESDNNGYYHERIEHYYDFFKSFHDVNRVLSLVDYSEFYVKNLTSYVNVVEEFLSKYEFHNSPTIFDLPFLLDGYVKSISIFVRRFLNTLGIPFVLSHRNLWGLEQMEDILGASDPLRNFSITVRRDQLYEDTLEYMQNVDLVQKNLFVTFSGEDGYDQGGVKKEYFLLLFQEIFEPDKHIFNRFDESHLFWFPEHMSSLYPLYGTIGLLFGLSLYNGTIYEFNFPIAFYQKLLDKMPDFKSLEELDPTFARNLTFMLEYEGDDFEEIFDITFQVTRNVYGSYIMVDLIPNGSSIRVNQDNKKAYVDALVDYIFNKSCEKEFNEFKKEFFRCDIGFLTEFVNEYELQELMNGSSTYEFTDLQKYTLYKDEFYPDHPTIRMFWEVFYEFSLQQKKKFLQFVSGTDKVPIKGFKSLYFTIEPMKTSDKHLPCSHTCFNVLDLPIYSSKAILKEKLTKAIENCIGFALV